MDDRTLTALKASIQHWRENVAAETPDGASIEAIDCALCDEFWRDNCVGCPVHSATSRTYCVGTPYTKAFRALDIWDSDPASVEKRDKWRQAAQAKLDFLISLLPESE